MTVTGPGVSVVERSAVTRNEVLELAGEIFARNGYRATNLKLVAERLNVTRQALYYHFGKKAEILAALFDKLMTALERSVEDVSTSCEAGDRFHKMLRIHIRTIAGNADLAAVLLHERPEIARIGDLGARDRRRAYTRLFVDAYEDGVRAGTLKALDPVPTVNAVLGAVNAVSWWYRPGPDDSVELLYEVLSSGFGRPAA